MPISKIFKPKGEFLISNFSFFATGTWGSWVRRFYRSIKPSEFYGRFTVQLRIYTAGFAIA